MMPAATVIVATYNRPAKITACLEALMRLDYPDFRVIVVDDGSPEPIAPLAAPFGERVRIIRQANAGPAAARHAGVRAAETEFLAFTDDDCAPASDWLSRLAAAHIAEPEALLGGKVVNALTDNIYATASQALCDYLYDHYRDGRSDAAFFTTNNTAFSKRAYEAVGGLDLSFRYAAGEDRDLGIRWSASGRPLRYVPGAVVAHAHDLTLRKFWRQHAHYGAGARNLHRTMAQRGDSRPKTEPLTFYTGIVCYPFRTREPQPAVQALLMGLSQVAMVSGYAGAVAEERRARRAAD